LAEPIALGLLFSSRLGGDYPVVLNDYQYRGNLGNSLDVLNKYSRIVYSEVKICVRR
jgi:hypothetical protein